MPLEPVEQNLYEMNAAERKACAVPMLPASLNEAITLVENSEVLNEALGKHVFSSFIENKKHEWYEYKFQVTEYELNK